MAKRSMTGRGAIAAVLMLALPVSSPSAGEVAERASEAEALLQQGKGAEALAAFDKAAAAFWAGLPLQFRTAAFATSISGFGRYEPRADTIFRSGDTATIYVEPAGYGFAGSAPAFAIGLSIGIQVQTQGGLTLARSDDFGSIRWEGRNPSRELHTALSVTLPALKPGGYKLLVRMTDAASGKSATAELPFRIAGSPSATRGP